VVASLLVQVCARKIYAFRRAESLPGWKVSENRGNESAAGNVQGTWRLIPKTSEGLRRCLYTFRMANLSQILREICDLIAASLSPNSTKKLADALLFSAPSSKALSIHPSLLKIVLQSIFLAFTEKKGICQLLGGIWAK
jgi:hypothetical protein